MTDLEREYFKTFTLERLKALRKSVSEEQKNGFFRGTGYVVRSWQRPGGTQVFIKLNRRKIDRAIKELEENGKL